MREDSMGSEKEALSSERDERLLTRREFLKAGIRSAEGLFILHLAGCLSVRNTPPFVENMERAGSWEEGVKILKHEVFWNPAEVTVVGTERADKFSWKAPRVQEAQRGAFFQADILAAKLESPETIWFTHAHPLEVGVNALEMPKQQATRDRERQESKLSIPPSPTDVVSAATMVIEVDDPKIRLRHAVFDSKGIWQYEFRDEDKFLRPFLERYKGFSDGCKILQERNTLKAFAAKNFSGLLLNPEVWTELFYAKRDELGEADRQEVLSLYERLMELTKWLNEDYGLEEYGKNMKEYAHRSWQELRDTPSERFMELEKRIFGFFQNLGMELSFESYSK